MNTDPKNSRTSEGDQAHPEQAFPNTNPQQPLQQPNAAMSKAAQEFQEFVRQEIERENALAQMNPWDRARKIKVSRGAGGDPVLGELEPGVNFFILMLEQLGATTIFSCEGHPYGFYVMFVAPYKTALLIEQCGFFSVEIESLNTWVLRLSDIVSEEDRVETLCWAAEAWESRLGKLAILAQNKGGQGHD